MSKMRSANAWLTRLKQFLQNEPKTQRELIKLLRDAQLRALINSDTLAMIEGAIVFSKMRARDIMLPQSQMVWIKKSEDFSRVIQIITESGHSRFPVMDDNGEEVIGILHAKDLLIYQMQGGTDFDLLNICRQVLFVPEGRRLDQLFSEFRRSKNHMAIVVDEYGEVSGFITIEDSIEQIVGEIYDEFDIDEDTDIKVHDDGHYIIKAQTPIEKFNALLNTQFGENKFDTLGGVLMHHFGHLPARGEAIRIEHLEFKIISADARSIKLIECIVHQE